MKVIFGTVKVEGSSVRTHRDSYLLASLSVVSTRRPFLGASLLVGVFALGFTISFWDLLYPTEIATTAALPLVGIFLASQIGLLSLLSRDLRGSELSGVIWGHYHELTKVRLEIVKKLDTLSNGDVS